MIEIYRTPKGAYIWQGKKQLCRLELQDVEKVISALLLACIPFTCNIVDKEG